MGKPCRAGDDDMRTDFIDFPTAWEIQHRCGVVLDHHENCSAQVRWQMLCDCGAIENRWRWLCQNPGHVLPDLAEVKS